MPKRTVPALVIALMTVVGAGLLGPAGAGQLGGGSASYGFHDLDNGVTVEKVLEGPVPAISDPFVVEITCVSTGQGGDLGPFTVQFGADGLPADLSTYSVGPDYTCTVIETVTHGAVVTYSCEALGEAECTDDQTVVFGDTTGVDAVFTVTNTFEAPVDTAPDEAAPEVVAAQPAFTG